jgi:hypothetical protein
VFTLVISPLLYFYPPNIPLKLKMTLLGIAFLLALGGLFVLDILSYWLSVAAMVAIAFIASYIAEKRMSVLDGNGEKTEIILSFSDEESESVKDAGKEEQQDEPANLESAVSLDEIPVLETSEEISKKQEATLEVIEELALLEIESLKTDEINEEDSEALPINDKNQIDLIETAQTDSSEIESLPELTEDEFAFLSEGREFEEKEPFKTPVVSDINDEELISQRSIILDELEELEDLSLHEETLEAEQELVGEPLSNIEEISLIELDEKVEEAEETPEVEDMLVDAEPQEDEVPLSEEPIDAIEQLEDIESADSKALVSKEEQTNEASTEEMESILIPDDMVPQNEEVPVIPESFQMPPQEDHHESAGESEVEAESQHDTEDDTNEEQVTTVDHIETNDAAAEETEPVRSVQPNMDPDMQDMLLTTLTSYEHQGDTDSYNAMLQTILNQTLSDQDYYLFSKLLLESYFSMGDAENSKLLLTSMKARLSEYPIIAEELESFLDKK